LKFLKESLVVIPMGCLNPKNWIGFSITVNKGDKGKV